MFDAMLFVCYAMNKSGNLKSFVATLLPLMFFSPPQTSHVISSAGEKGSGVFVIDDESIVMRKWQILEFDGKPYYAFVPENDIPLEECMIPEEEEIYIQEEEIVGEESLEKSMEKFKDEEQIEEMSAGESAFNEFEDLTDEVEQQQVQSKPITPNGKNKKTARDLEEDEQYENYFQVKVEDGEVLIEKLDMNLLETVEAETENSENLEELVDDPTDDEEGQDSSLEYAPKTRNPAKSAPKDDGVSLKCKVCSEMFVTNMAFRKHVAWTHRKKVYIKDGNTYICSVCDYSTVKKNLFIAHLQRKHETWSNVKSSRNVFPCAACGFECRSKHSLKSHFVRKHTDRFEHQCKVCPKMFKVKGDLTNHIRFHHKEQPVNCDVCGKRCMNSGSLYVHKKWAHFKPKFECSICKRRMVTQENLDQHMVSQHEKREKIVCAECGKTFTKKDSFKRHMSVHTGSKPHNCIICGKAFARASQLRQHLLIHTGKRPFVCDICGKAFTQKPGLICHRKTHPGVHPPLPVMPIGDIVKEFTDRCAEGDVEFQE